MIKENTDELVKALTPVFLGVLGAIIAVTSLLVGRDATITIAGLGTGASFASGASGLARSPEKRSYGGVQNAENVDIRN